jgi:hypothetical protein
MRHIQWECAMHLQPLSRPRATLALWMIGSSLVSLPATASEVAPTAALIAEARRAFTLNGKQNPVRDCSRFRRTSVLRMIGVGPNGPCRTEPFSGATKAAFGGFHRANKRSAQ